LTQEAQQEIDSSDTVKQNATQRYLRFNFRLKCCIQLRSQDSDLPMKVVWTNWTSVFSSTQVKTFGSFIIKAPRGLSYCWYLHRTKYSVIYFM
jgi:hypothetical protein